MALIDLNDRAFVVEVGDLVTRRDLASHFGGSGQSGIETPKGQPHIFVFSDPSTGSKHGYNFDGWAADGSAFFYTGAGRLGPQEFVRGNKALKDARSRGKTIHLFAADGNEVGTSTRLHRYLGEFELDQVDPHRVEEAPDGIGIVRTVIVFRLVPRGTATATISQDLIASAPPAMQTGWFETTREASDSLSFPRKAVAESAIVRRERLFEDRLISAIEATGKTATRLSIVIPGQGAALFTDTWVREDRELFEVKADATRNNIRMAVGQLLDYARHIDPRPSHLTVVVPVRPVEDLVEFVKSLGLGIAVFDTNAAGAQPSLNRL